MTTATLDQRKIAAAIAEKHTGWIVWTSKPIATRGAGIHHHRNPPPGYCQTIVADDWTQLDRELAAQDANDAAHPS